MGQACRALGSQNFQSDENPAKGFSVNAFADAEASEKGFCERRNPATAVRIRPGL